MNTVDKKGGKWAKRMRKMGTYGPLDRALRRWRFLGSVRSSTGARPNGDAMVYRMNETTLEIGQGINAFKGMMGFAGFIFFGFVVFLIFEIFSFFINDGPLGFVTSIFYVIAVIFSSFMGCLFLSVFIADFFGYTDALLRFDRVRRKVWMFVGTREPIELDWDHVKPVSQGVTPAGNINTFRAVLLVDLDADGDVKFEGRFPRIASLGQTALNEQEAIGQYEYVRQFMENGPHGLPPCKTYLEHRSNLRTAVGFGSLDLIREYPSSEEDNHLKKIVMLTLFWAVMSCGFLPFWMSTWLAYRLNRVPKWPARIEAYAAEGGPLHPPEGAQSLNRSIIWREVPFIVLWLGTAFSVYGWVASHFIG